MAGGSKSKNKGNGAERELCALLSGFLGGSFTRVPNSGAMTGGKNAWRMGVLSETQGRIYKGDIIPPDHLPKLVLESKFYADFRFHQLMQPGPVPQLDTWIGQAKEAIVEGDFWMVCFKINLRGWYVALAQEFEQEFEFGNHCRYTGAHGRFVVTDLKDFFSLNSDSVTRLSK